jgi:hypothetical protein
MGRGDLGFILFISIAAMAWVAWVAGILTLGVSGLALLGGRTRGRSASV